MSQRTNLKIQHTYLEDGVAIPHSLIGSAENIAVELATAKNPIKYTNEGEKANTFAVLIGPSSMRGEQLAVISSIVQLLTKHELKKVLFGNLSGKQSFDLDM